jgi:hypothetical protein
MPDPQGDPDPQWIKDLKWLICKLYETYGGDCSELQLDVSAQIGELEAEYAAHGPPPVDDEAAAANLEEILNSLEAHLALPANTLSANDTARLTALIGSLRSAGS